MREDGPQKDDKLKGIKEFAQANGFDITVDEEEEDEYAIAARFKITKEVLD